MRLDLYLVKHGLTESRERAKELIKSGAVALEGQIITKPAFEVFDEKIEITASQKYVSRGGYKLEFALQAFDLDTADLVCMDIGASTGGFTDCLLQSGAKLVYAVDVGTAQLHPSLKSDPRVISAEQTDFRKLEAAAFPPIDLFVCDVSFISATKILPALKSLMHSSSKALILIKPQFEIKGRHKNGIIKSKSEREKAVENVLEAAKALGLEPKGVKECPFTGKDGNIEYFLLV
jgi:23S rRNA (cytidine1920-2'-O)/16S rRNA (cytidine1409-2'-O)-methyltransferase